MTDKAYGYQHQLRRAAAMTALIDGTPCPVCGLGMYREVERNPGQSQEARIIWATLPSGCSRTP
jgi:hypothetical protein